MPLSPRLSAVASLVPKDSRVADIGCDHGYLSVFLVTEGIAPHCIASDVVIGPLSRAKENVSKAGLCEFIDLRLGDGLSGISPEECDCIVLAGMGGDNMQDILSAAPWIGDGRHTLVLQPQSHEDTLRLWLLSQGFSIEEERTVKDRRMVYRAFRVIFKRSASTPLSAYVSPAYLSLPKAERAEYDARMLKRIRARIAGLEAGGEAEKAKKLSRILLELSEELSK